MSPAWRRFSTVIEPPSRTTLTGVVTAANSASIGVGVPSDSTMPSQTNEPSWISSPKSPP